MTLQAEPETGYVFVRWSGDLEGERDNPFTVIVERDMTIGAVFREKSSVPIWAWALIGIGVAAGAVTMTYLNKRRLTKRQ